MHFSDSVTAFQSVKELFDPTACRQQQNSQRLFKTENNNHPPSRRGQDRPVHVSPRTSSWFQSRNQSFINIFITLSSFCLICIKGPVCRSWCTSQSSGVFFLTIHLSRLEAVCLCPEPKRFRRCEESSEELFTAPGRGFHVTTRITRYKNNMWQ